MAPPKRKTNGRTTPKGTKPGESKSTSNSSGVPSGVTSGTAKASSRYTPPASALGHMNESPRWVPILMGILFAVGAALILTRYLFDTPQWMVFVGLAFIMGGLYTATKWR